MTAEATGQGLFILLTLTAVILYLLFLVGRALHQRHQLWKYISEDENLADPLQLLYCYKAREIENSESGSENQQ